VIALPAVARNEGARARRSFIRAASAVIVFGSLHHGDHILRGNHIGWPFINEVNPFTYSLAMYPLMLIGLIATLRGQRWAGYWLAVALIGLLTAGPTHLGPWAVEPPADIYTPYADPLFYCQTSAPPNRVAFWSEVYAPIASPLWAVLAIAVMVSLLVSLLVLAGTALYHLRRA
jgi:hypothetical protein